MELAAIFSTAFVIGLSGAMMPGPLLSVTISESVKRGFWAGPLIVLGHGILELVLVIALAMGLALFLGIPTVTRVIAVAGGLFLSYLGWEMVRDAGTGKAELAVTSSNDTGDTGDGQAGGKPRSIVSFPVWAGIFISLSNPYWSLWWATVGLSYIIISLKQGLPGLASFFSGHILSDLAWYCVVAAMASGGRRFLVPVVYRGIIGMCGLFLLGLGIYFVFQGLRA